MEFKSASGVVAPIAIPVPLVSSKRHFVGKWLVGQGNGDSFYISLEENGEAAKSIGAAHGTWVYVDGEARITWDDGWHDAIRKVGSKHEKFAYAPGKSFSDNPTNVTEARNTSPSEFRPQVKPPMERKIAAKLSGHSNRSVEVCMTSFWQDVRYSLRMIAKAPGYRGDRHSDACAGYRREHHDLQLDQLDIAESDSRAGQPERGSGAVARPARG